MKWVNINESGLPVEAVAAAARDGELVAGEIDGALYVAHEELGRWLATKHVPSTAADRGLAHQMESLTALRKAKHAHKEIFDEPGQSIIRPTRRDYKALWIETGKDAGHYVAEVKTPDGEWRRYEMKDPKKLIHFYNDVNDYGSAMDEAYVTACRVLADFAVDSELAENASEQKMKKGRPTKVKRAWLANAGGNGGEWAAKLTFSNKTSFLVPLHRKSKPLFTTKKLDKEQREALARELFEAAQKEYEH